MSKRIKLQILDTAGLEKFKSMTTQFYRDANGVMMVYDCTEKETFDMVRDYWDGQITEAFEGKTPVVKMVVGNKSDLSDKKQVNGLDAKVYSRNNDFLFAEVSALSDENVTAAFEQLVLQIIADNP